MKSVLNRRYESMNLRSIRRSIGDFDPSGTCNKSSERRTVFGEVLTRSAFKWNGSSWDDFHHRAGKFV